MQISAGQQMTIVGRPDPSSRPGVKFVRVGNCDVCARVENLPPNSSGVGTTTINVLSITGATNVTSTELINALAIYPGHAATV